MLKSDVKKLVLDRAPTRYPKSVVAVLVKLVELTYVPDFRTDHIEALQSSPKSLSRLAFLTNLHWNTVKRAINTLLADRVITRNKKNRDSYSIDPQALQSMKSKFKSQTAQALERKIMKAVRMRFQRNADRPVAPWSEEHETCTCEAGFCSHPSAIDSEPFRREKRLAAAA